MADNSSTVFQYADKPRGYFEGARHDIVAALPHNPQATILEIGCGNGATGIAAKAEGRCARYIGVELAPGPAQLARTKLDQVILGDVEILDWSRIPTPVDVVILSEVLEHLVDPWVVVNKAYKLLREGGKIFASSPNIASMSVLMALLRGQFDYQEAGVMDRTHLRWFTPLTYSAMFEDAGFDTISIGPLAPLRWKWRAVSKLLAGRFKHLGANQIMYVGQK